LPVEYLCLAIMGIFSLVAFLPASKAKADTFGLKFLAGNRDHKPQRELPAWGDRAERAHNNLKENLPGFIIAVLLLGATNHFTYLTAVCAIVYVVSRLGHFVVYIAGIGPLRSLCWVAAMVANFIMYVQLFL